ncbi:MAG: hypothetical protein QY322_01255 [bacterium]|nr:MAG: hypothetical protein QY322_01255 [bacterium]
MAKVTIVNELPVVDSTHFPELPKDFKGKHYVMFDSKWQSYEEENVAALILTAVARSGKWEPVSWSNFVALIKDGGVTREIGLGSDLGLAIQRVAITGDIELIKLGNEVYLVPTPVLAETVKRSIIRYY